jgi:Fe-S-cluster-containing dehydrogenase component
MDRVSLYINQKNCMGCHACEVACKQEHGLKVGPHLIQVVEKAPRFIPIYCHQCGNAPCQKACPVDAIVTNDQGIVQVIAANCIGCRVCVDACPFGAMAFDESTALAMNCDVCVRWLAVGKQPACASICPTHCITVTGSKKSIASVFERAAA